MKQLRALILLLRPQQWAKNAFIFLPLFFSSKIMEWDKLWAAVMAFIVFSLIASSVYCFNDLLDIEADRQHPNKCHRPLASGVLQPWSGWVLMISSLAGAVLVGCCSTLPIHVTCIGLGYFGLNIAYTLWLKHIAIVDVLVIAIGFVLRIGAGSAATSVPLSHWIVLMTFLLALFLAFAKRRDDVLIFDRTGIKMRENIVQYNVVFLNSVLSLLSAVTIVCYIMYTVSPEVVDRLQNPYLYLTSFFVITGILRYMQLTQVTQKSGSPTKILYRDRFIQLTVLGWIVMFSIIIYVL